MFASLHAHKLAQIFTYTYCHVAHNPRIDTIYFSTINQTARRSLADSAENPASRLVTNTFPMMLSPHTNTYTALHYTGNNQESQNSMKSKRHKFLHLTFKERTNDVNKLPGTVSQINIQAFIFLLQLQPLPKTGGSFPLCS